MKKLYLLIVLLININSVFAQQKDGDYITFNLKSGEKIKTHDPAIFNGIESKQTFDVAANDGSKTINKSDVSSIIYNQYESGDLIKKEYKIFGADADKILLYNVIIKTDQYFLSYKKIAIKSAEDEDETINTLNYFILDKDKKVVAKFSSNEEAETQMNKYFSDQTELISFCKKQNWNLKKCKNNLLKAAAFLYASDTYKEEPIDADKASPCLKKLINMDKDDDENSDNKKSRTIIQEQDKSSFKGNTSDDPILSLDIETGLSFYSLTSNIYYPNYQSDDQQMSIAIGAVLNYQFKKLSDFASVGATSGFYYNFDIGDANIVHNLRLPILANIKLGGDATSDGDSNFGIGLGMGPTYNLLKINGEAHNFFDLVIVPEICLKTNRDNNIFMKLKGYINLTGSVDYTDNYTNTGNVNFEYKNKSLLVYSVTFLF